MIVHPGAVLSDGTKTALRTLYFSELLISIAGLIMYPPTKCAYTAIFAAATPRGSEHPEISHGAYIVPPNVMGVQAPVALDRKKQKELWDLAESVLVNAGV